jgi:GNAT superfamily N-acetyltransferase
LLRVEKIKDTDKTAIIQYSVTEFHGSGVSDADIAHFAEYYTDWELSRKLVLDGKMIGFYLLHEGSLNDLVSRYNRYKALEDLRAYANKRGVEGIILFVLPCYRGKGYGNLLKDLPRAFGYDYVYGEQFKATDTIKHWLKRRRLVADGYSQYGDVWVTLEDLTPVKAVA